MASLLLPHHHHHPCCSLTVPSSTLSPLATTAHIDCSQLPPPPPTSIADNHHHHLPSLLPTTAMSPSDECWSMRWINQATNNDICRHSSCAAHQRSPPDVLHCLVVTCHQWLAPRRRKLSSPRAVVTVTSGRLHPPPSPTTGTTNDVAMPRHVPNERWPR